MNKTWRGNDHSCSLEPDEFKDLVTRIRLTETALGEPVKKVCLSETPCLLKLGKTIVLKKVVKAGDILQKDDLSIKVSEPRGIDGALADSIIGRKVKIDLDEDEPLLLTHLY